MVEGLKLRVSLTLTLSHRMGEGQGEGKRAVFGSFGVFLGENRTVG